MTISTIEQAQQRNTKAQKALFEQYANSIYRLSFRYLREQMEAEDVVSETFCIAFEKMKKASFSNVYFFEAWLKKIAVNEALKALKKRTNFYLFSNFDFESVSVHEEAIEALTTTQILELVAQLPVGYRTVFNLYEIEGYSHAEVAKMLNISEGTSKSQLSKGKAILQKRVIELNQEYGKSKIIR